MKPLRVALLEPWLGGSHAAWAEGLVAHSAHDISVIGLPDRAWRWRLRASAPWFAEQLKSVTVAPDVLLVSGLVDVAALRGLLGRDIPVVLYMHESQATYPRTTDDDGVEATIRNWNSMLAADTIWFNSDYHQRVALAAIEQLESALPIEQRLATAERLRSVSTVLYPGVELDWVRSRPPNRSGPPVILWPHRWENDKNPEVFARALDRLVKRNLEFRLVLAGTDGTPPNPTRESIVHRYANNVLAVGPFDLDTYRQWVQQADIVVSCTGHEFFGIGVVEALAAGSQPVLPNDFSYPEILGLRKDCLYPSGSFGTALETAISNWTGSPDPINVSRFSWPNRIAEYDGLLNQATASI